MCYEHKYNFEVYSESKLIFNFIFLVLWVYYIASFRRI